MIYPVGPIRKAQIRGEYKLYNTITFEAIKLDQDSYVLWDIIYKNPGLNFEELIDQFTKNKIPEEKVEMESINEAIKEFVYFLETNNYIRVR